MGTINSLQADNVIDGTPRDDVIEGTAFADRIFGLAGNDYIEGRDGDDVIDGGSGDDVIHGDSGDDVIDGGSGNDYVNGGSGNDVVHGGVGNDIVFGGTGDDEVYGDAGNDTLLIYRNHTTFNGIEFDFGTNQYYGGKGADTFRVDDPNGLPQAIHFTSAKIHDFEVGKDRIDLSPLDANPSVGGDQAFAFSSGPAANSVWISKVSVAPDAPVAATIVRADSDGDAVSDLDLILVGDHNLSAADFVF